jgi:DGQHR domain-containing protein
MAARMIRAQLRFNQGWTRFLRPPLFKPERIEKDSQINRSNHSCDSTQRPTRYRNPKRSPCCAKMGLRVSRDGLAPFLRRLSMPKRKDEELEYYQAAAVQFSQGGIPVYVTAIPGRDISQIAEISRLKKEGKKLDGFQRTEIQAHVKQIAEYLNQGPSLFPNAIILAMTPQVRFVQTRGRQAVDKGCAKPGYLQIPLFDGGNKAAWIVDGQQRSLALSKSNGHKLLVPVVAFVSASLDVQRQQFILVNRAKPLSRQLVNELLPETDELYLPRDLASAKIPSQLCTTLHETSRSPFYGRISRKSETTLRKDIINDSAVIRMIRERINSPTGALSHLKGYENGPSNLAEMYRVLEAYWSAVAAVFPNAWALPPEKSRLPHSAGIEAMGSLMDRIAGRIVELDRTDLPKQFEQQLRPLAKVCCWTNGTWPLINRAWNDVEQTRRSVTELTRAVNSLFMQVARK